MNKNYDVIIGYRADDSYFAFAQDFLNNAISLNTLNLFFTSLQCQSHSRYRNTS